MATLKEFRQFHFDASTKVSEITRTLAISAIAIVWLFKKDVGDLVTLSNELMLPLLLVVIVLALDFSQYVYRTIVWHYIFRQREGELAKNKITESTELYVDDLVNLTGYCLFYAKIIVMFIAYFYLIAFFLKAVKFT